ncbi:type II toxin-antitoxin system VapC family toxin [Pseudomonas sp. BN415]|uniref:type II toxin-antitoxin system VapC family toxin n=1 Tax=Pseudomonas sp. BN415 TaxID=2567889 RepID=UPI002456C429|nr:type II toxin-antitoxin system VapC family toxin [Pseudomonas sp. BN415]MDH4582514.1 type II toxin-antitoxin system VapC family toxin [Pseudomonas sp. BN415]
MILLDTNVLSELMRAKPDPNVIAWVDAQESSDLVICSITVAEILYGVAQMPDGKHKDALYAVATAMFDEDFAGNILPFEVDAAMHYPDLVAASEERGKIADMADGQIAAIARLHGARIVTRNVRHFEAFGIPLVNPWNE